jgi:sulfate transport system ATP-binding protein
MGIKVENVSRRFGDFQAVDQVSLEVKTGSLTALLGPSGSGKSTLLRLIAGLETLDEGRIWLTGRDATYQAVQDRHVGFVFQHYALFKHLTVRENIAFGLEIHKWPKNRVKNRVSELLELVQLTGLGDRYPSQLSGGQRQRVALARALAIEPNVLLLDEPFGALDTKVRKDLRNWIRRLHDEVHVTTVLVTHDQEEAMEIADEIVVMNKGCVEQIGSPAEIYDNPATPFVMSFIGPVNVLSGASHLLPDPSASRDSQRVFLRPHDVVIHSEPEIGTLPASVERLIHLGREIQVELSLADGQSLTAHISREHFNTLDLRRAQKVFVKARRDRIFRDIDERQLVTVNS